MSKYVKDLLTNEISQRLEGVETAMLVNVIGMEANHTVALRKRLREKDISLLVVKNSLARRATEGTPLAPAFEGIEGTHAVVWGAEDVVSLAKEVKALDDDKAEFAKFETRGGVLDGERLTPERIKDISKWPSREEMLSIISGQILAPGAELSAAMLGPGATLASQIKQKSESEEESAAAG